MFHAKTDIIFDASELHLYCSFRDPSFLVNDPVEDLIYYLYHIINLYLLYRSVSCTVYPKSFQTFIKTHSVR